MELAGDIATTKRLLDAVGIQLQVGCDEEAIKRQDEADEIIEDETTDDETPEDNPSEDETAEWLE